MGTVTWLSFNITASDDSYATASMTSGQVSHYLVATGYNFSIPAGAIILGIQPKIERSHTNVANGQINDSKVRIVKGGVIGTTDRADTTNWSGSDTTITYGSSTDLWGLTWTAADINANNFGFAISVVFPGGIGVDVPQVDYMPITVFYQVLGKGVFWETEDFF